MIELGKKGRDKISGFEGVITGRAQYLTGCDQYVLSPAIRNGEMQKSEWFDEGRIEVIGDGISASSVAGPKPGGPQRDAPGQ
ncbi:hypothetical protein V0R52_16470 [Pseudomonas asiatica]|uniref:hypothetical protein n=1 Tax=Pseudomonas asiatica TaxID=2219225 RepID=UPI002E7B53BB|nr:hypothetical protein [Pseudomonas asiatica]MEE1917984.1 hypothetical protein [Pseudomonas asiatica]